MPSRIVGWCVLLAVVGVAWSASAEIRPSDISRPADTPGIGPGYGARVTQYEGELGVYLGSDPLELSADVLNISPMFRVISPLSRHEVELAWGFTWHSIEADPAVLGDQETFRLGNPFLGWYYAWRTLPRQIRLGLGVAAPAATLREENPTETLVDLHAYGTAAAMRGQRDVWLWLPETLSVVAHFDVYFRHHFGLVWGGQVKVANLVGIGDIPGLNDDYDLLTQADLEVAYELSFARMTLRASYIRRNLSDADDVDQITIEPDFRWRLGGVDLLTRLSMPIDEPAGFAFGEGGVWGLHVGVGSPTERRLPED